MQSKAWIISGGWDGHQPQQVAEILANELREEGFDVDIVHELERLRDTAALAEVDLLVPNWTMGQISKEQLSGLVQAVEAGTGIAGLHGGMGDAFRCEPAYQWIVGGQFMAHPGGQIAYDVHIIDPRHPVTQGLVDFAVTTEQYYMLIDPANEVLATTQFGPVTMPVAWLKTFGHGRVFYCSLGHDPEIAQMEPVRTLMRRGMVYVSRKHEEVGE